MRVFAVSSLLIIASAAAWVSSPRKAHRTATATRLQQTTQSSSRSEFLKQSLVGAGAAALLGASNGLAPAAPAFAADATLPNGVTYTVLKSGNGPKPEIGELVAIRFAAYNGEVKIDDIFDTPEPYYTRLGSGGLLKGVEETLPLMRVGDRWKLTIPVRVY